jgi:hypothetical protein
MKTRYPSKLLGYLVLFAALAASVPAALAHCDTLDGPVVNAARKALSETNVNLVLIWVQKADDAEIRKAFDKTLAVRRLNAEARELADLYFFETLVRIHRAGEGAPYTGLRPAGTDLGSAIPAADQAIVDGKVEPLTRQLTGTVHDGLQKKFATVHGRKNFAANDVEAGRAYVKAYVEFVHYVEGVHTSATRGSAEHPAAETSAAAHEHH